MTYAPDPCTPGRHRPESYVPLLPSIPPAATTTRFPSSPGMFRPGSSLSFSDRFRLSRITRSDPPYSSGLPCAARSTTSLLGSPSKRSFPSPGPKRQYSIGLGRTGSTSFHTPTAHPSFRILSRLNGLTAPSSLPSRLRSSAPKGKGQNPSSLRSETDWGDPWADAVVAELPYPFKDDLGQTDPELRRIQEQIRNVINGDEAGEISKDCKEAALGARVLRSIGPLDGYDDLVLRQALRSMVKSSEERSRALGNAWSPLRIQKKQTPSQSSSISQSGRTAAASFRRSSLGRGGTAPLSANKGTLTRASTMNSLRRKPVPRLATPSGALPDPDSPTPTPRRRQVDSHTAVREAAVGSSGHKNAISPTTGAVLQRSSAIKAAPSSRRGDRPQSGDQNLIGSKSNPLSKSTTTLNQTESSASTSSPQPNSSARTPLGPAKQLPAPPPFIPGSSPQQTSPMKAPRAARMSTLIPTTWSQNDQGMTAQSPLARPRPPFARGLATADTEGKMMSRSARPRRQ